MNAESEIKQPSPRLKTLITAGVILLAVALVGWRFWDYIVNPWTRNGQVMAQVIQITPRVSGPLVELPIVDNQLVKAGDLLLKPARSAVGRHSFGSVSARVRIVATELGADGPILGCAWLARNAS